MWTKLGCTHRISSSNSEPANSKSPLPKPDAGCMSPIRCSRHSLQLFHWVHEELGTGRFHSRLRFAPLWSDLLEE
jgi:hypothetical protein